MPNVTVFKQFAQELNKKLSFSTENLYRHTISLKLDTGRMIVFDIDNNYGFDMTWAQVKKYIQDNYSASTADITSSGRFMPCVGVTGNYTAIGFAWASNRGGWVIVFPVSGGSVDWSGVTDGSNIYILSQKTIPLMINNALKPSYKQFTTNLTYNGSKIGDITWTCYKYPLGDGKFRYEWSASGSGSASVTWEVWSSSVTWSYTPKLVIAYFPTDYATNIINNLTCNMYLEDITANQMLSLDSSNIRCYFESPNTVPAGTRTIRFTGHASYIANS